MTESLPSYQGIKVNLITGFLGAGKTTLIKHLLTQIPKGERWAVLVNEFGEIGLDQTLLETSLNSGKHKELSEQVAIKQVAGGCVCCATSAAFQVALNTLIKSQNPDRIIIEPTGLGHPRNILKQLNGSHYQGVLDIEPSVCLLDARNLGDERYTSHPNFIEQVAMADILVASKSETYQSNDWLAFEGYLDTLVPAKARVETIANGKLALSQIFLEQAVPTVYTKPDQGGKGLERSRHYHSHHDSQSHSEKKTLSNSDTHNQEDFYFKVSEDGLNMAWKFPQTVSFDQALLESVLEKLNGVENILRMKGVFNLASGALIVNSTQRDFAFYANEKKQTESKFELILSADTEMQNQDQIQSWVLSLL